MAEGFQILYPVPVCLGPGETSDLRAAISKRSLPDPA